MKFWIVCSFLLLINIFVKAQNVTLTGVNYDEKVDKTSLLVFPLGNVNIPGKWKQTGYNQVSRQHFFENGDSTIITIAKNAMNKYPFFISGETDNDFVKAFFKWDSEYWSKQGGIIKILTDNLSSGYIVWQVTNAEHKVNNVLLFGAKNGAAYGLSASSAKWDDTQKEKFLTDLYISN